MKMFPVLGAKAHRIREDKVAWADCPESVPWEMLVPHEQSARRNHSQSLATLASRGGLDPNEMLAILDDVSWKKKINIPVAQAIAELRARIIAWEKEQKPLRTVRMMGFDEATKTLEHEEIYLWHKLSIVRLDFDDGPMGKYSVYQTALNGVRLGSGCFVNREAANGELLRLREALDAGPALVPRDPNA